MTRLFLKFKIHMVCLALIAFLGQSCTPKKIASDITAQIMTAGAPSFEMESDIEIAKNASMTMLKMIEAFQYDNPKNKNLNTLLARSYANYTQGFVEFDMLAFQDVDEAKYQKSFQRAKDFYTKGKDFGLKALTTNGAYKRALNKDLGTYEKALKSFGRGAVPQMFWTAMNWGSLINLSKDSPIAIAEFPKAEALMARVLKLDENYFYGGPHLFFGFSYGARPKLFGGDLAKSKVHFEKALSAYQRKFLMGLVFYAQIYAIEAKDAQLFDSLLNEVLSADATALPEARLANEMAKIRARWLLDNKAKFFSY
ncbi:MAG: hypothetical protein HQM16_08480 [Deltaproteobacteria bacterium]|nr:hypothetical protein [Deltaproteobacteria bacterium]